RGLPLPLDGDGAQVFAPVFVGDVVAAFHAAVELRAGGIYNVGGEPRAVSEVADLVLRLCAADARLAGRRRTARRLVQLCDPSRAASVLGVRQPAVQAGLTAETERLRFLDLGAVRHEGRGG